VSKFTNTGASISTGYTGAGINAPNALTIDGNGLVWIANSTGTLSVLKPSGAAVAAAAYAIGASSPTSINVDGSGNLWLTNVGDNSVTEVIGAAAPVTTPTTTAVQSNSVAAKP
jgi:streptogramin lyase